MRACMCTGEGLGWGGRGAVAGSDEAPGDAFVFQLLKVERVRVSQAEKKRGELIVQSWRERRTSGGMPLN